MTSSRPGRSPTPPIGSASGQPAAQTQARGFLAGRQHPLGIRRTRTTGTGFPRPGGRFLRHPNLLSSPFPIPDSLFLISHPPSLIPAFPFPIPRSPVPDFGKIAKVGDIRQPRLQDFTGKLVDFRDERALPAKGSPRDRRGLDSAAHTSVPHGVPPFRNRPPIIYASREEQKVRIIFCRRKTHAPHIIPIQLFGTKCAVEFLAPGV